MLGHGAADHGWEWTLRGDHQGLSSYGKDAQGQSLGYSKQCCTRVGPSIPSKDMFKLSPFLSLLPAPGDLRPVTVLIYSSSLSRTPEEDISEVKCGSHVGCRFYPSPMGQKGWKMLERNLRPKQQKLGYGRAARFWPILPAPSSLLTIP